MSLSTECAAGLLSFRYASFTVITVPHFSVCFVVIYARLHVETPLS